MTADAPTSSSSDAKPLKLPFRPRARLLQLLGDQLIGSARLAVFELVKNGYDADATTVTVTLQEVDKPTASIVVEDDGEGMSFNVIRNIWLVPGHDHRERQRKAMQRTPKGRLPLGEKGVGRFAAHKLGNRIELVTRSAGQLECVVSIDWRHLISVKELADARVEVATRDPEVFPGDVSGTKITVSELREKWTRGEVRRLQRQVTTIASPYATRPDRFETRLAVPGKDWLDDIPDAATLLERAPWRYRFRFVDGLLDWDYSFRGVPGIQLEPRTASAHSQPLLVESERDPDELDGKTKRRRRRVRKVTADASIADEIGPVEGQFRVFDRDREVLSKMAEGHLLEQYLDGNGGVRVYRDGIRVYTYGEPEDDWLGLDLSRVNRPRRGISRNIVVGAIDLSLAASDGLKEKTNREGFVENPVQKRLRSIVRAALTPLEAERTKDKRRIRDLTSTGRTRETRRLGGALKKLRAAAQRTSHAKELAPLIDDVAQEYDELRDSMLRAGLSGVGLAVIFHEVEHGVRGLCELIESGGERGVIRVRARELARILEGFTELLRKGPRKPNSLTKLARRVCDINRVRFRKHKVRLVCNALNEDAAEIESTFVFGLALGALNNLLDNSFYWLRVRWPDESAGHRALYVDVKPELDGGPAIVVADNGTGFVDEPSEIVMPFFSRRPEGMGLGLYYANLVMELSDGHLSFPTASQSETPTDFNGALLAMVFPRGTAR